MAKSSFNYRKTIFFYILWLKSILGSSVFVCTLSSNSRLTVSVHYLFIYEVISFFKYQSQSLFSSFSDISCTDFISIHNRVEICYQILSKKYSNRLSLKVFIPLEVSLSSVCSVFKAANWFEREVFDMFGVYFEDHPNLSRILTDYGFEGFPLRKDFPLIGYSEVFYDFTSKRVLCHPLHLSQEFRSAELLFKKNLGSSVSFYSF